MRAALVPPSAIRWLLAPLIALSLVAFAFPAPAQAQPPPPPPGECTAVPEYYFHSACVEHDDCYSPSSYLSRRQCDDDFRSDMHHVCETEPAVVLVPPYTAGCKVVAEGYYQGVVWWGEDHYDGRGGDGYDDDDDDDDDVPPPPPPGPAGGRLAR